MIGGPFAPLGLRDACGRLQRGQAAPCVPRCQTDQVLEGVLGQFDRPGEPAVVVGEVEEGEVSVENLFTNDLVDGFNS